MASFTLNRVICFLSFESCWEGFHFVVFMHYGLGGSLLRYCKICSSGCFYFFFGDLIDEMQVSCAKGEIVYPFVWNKGKHFPSFF